MKTTETHHEFVNDLKRVLVSYQEELNPLEVFAILGDLMGYVVANLPEEMSKEDVERMLLLNIGDGKANALKSAAQRGKKV
jgi:hypothetical protein